MTLQRTAHTPRGDDEFGDDAGLRFNLKPESADTLVGAVQLSRRHH